MGIFSETQTLSEYFLHWLHAVDCHHLFMVPGSHLDDLYQAVTAPDSPVMPVLATHELSAAYMADGYGRYRHTLGAVAAIGGPGASHLTTAVITAARDQKPLLVISGDVPQAFSDWPVFQNAGPSGTQDLKSLSGLVRWSGRLEVAQDLPHMLNQAWQHAMTLPYGPVHVQIPANLFLQKVPAFKPRQLPEPLRQDISELGELMSLFAEERHLLCYAGSGLFSAQAERCIAELLQRHEVPLITTLCRRGLLPESDDLNLGPFGFAGQSQTRDVLFLPELRVVLLLGVELTDRNTLNWAAELFSEDRQIVLVNPVCSDLLLEAYPQIKWIQADPQELLIALCHQLPDPEPELLSARRRWLSELHLKVKSKQQKMRQPESPDAALLKALFSALQSELPSETPIFVDAGLSKLYAGSYWQVETPGAFFLSAQTGAMGWALAAAIGAAFACPHRVLVVTGDGCLQMQGMELITAVRYQLPITFIVINNQSLGSVALRMPHDSPARKQLQTAEVNWQAFGGSLGMQSFKLSDLEGLAVFISQHQQVSGPILLEVLTELPLALEYPELLKAAFS